MGYIYGFENRDQYVMLGNHYDAWVYGSIDPNSATAVLAEVARAMVETIKETNWRPGSSIHFLSIQHFSNFWTLKLFISNWRELKTWFSARTIMFCNWDAEEYGLIGSTEFVEEFANILSQRAIVYLNVDNIHSNQSLLAYNTANIVKISYNCLNPKESRKF